MPRVLLLLPTTTYRTKAYVDAALKLNVDVVAASEQPSTLASRNPEGLLTLDFSEPEQAARQAREFANRFPIDAVIPVDEDTAVVAAAVARGLKLRHNPVDAASQRRSSPPLLAFLSGPGPARRRRASLIPVRRQTHIPFD